MAPITFTSTDGTVFSDRQKWRAYEMESQYTYRNLNNETKTKPVDSVQGQVSLSVF